MTKTKKLNLHKTCLDMARNLVAKHIEEDGDEKCFNLFTFLEAVEYQLESLFNGSKAPNGNFQLAAPDVARYLWCCLALESGDATDGNTFRGMPILD